MQDRNALIVSRLSSSVQYRGEVLSEHTLHLWILYVRSLQILQNLYLSAARRPCQGSNRPLELIFMGMRTPVLWGAST